MSGRPGNFIDLTGLQVGRLTVRRLDEERRGKQGQRYWVCACACGRVVSILGQSLRRQSVVSCGCHRQAVIEGWRDRPRTRKRCVVCGAWYECPPSAKKVTCSKACQSIQRAQALRGRTYKKGPEARARLSATGQTGNLKLGTPAAKSSPLAGPYMTNVNAKTWTLQSPDGVVYREVRNLNHFCRQHAAAYDSTPAQMSAGIRAIKQSMTGKRRGKVSRWRGWELVGWGE